MSTINSEARSRGIVYEQGLGDPPEYAMHCESAAVQKFYSSRLAELQLKAGRMRWLIGLPATSIKQQATESNYRDVCSVLAQCL